MPLANAALDLLNSVYQPGPGQVVDDLGDDAWLAAFLARWTLPEPHGARDRERLRALREDLRAVVDEVMRTREVSDDALRRLQAWLPPEKTQARLRCDPAGTLVLVEETAAPRPATAEVVRAFAGLLAGDGRLRLKVCQNDDCLVTFFDESRNRSRRWCDPADCGNVMKVRAFRRRQGAAGAPGEAA